MFLFPFFSYSFDQGRCWNTLKFNNEPLVIRGLVTEPNAKKRAFSLWGYKTNQVPKEWRVITVDFGKLFKRPCKFLISGFLLFCILHCDSDGHCLAGIYLNVREVDVKIFIKRSRSVPDKLLSQRNHKKNFS